MNIFKKKYTLRKFSEQRTAKGFAVKASYTDQVVLLNVQPMVATEMKTLPEGDIRQHESGHGLQNIMLGVLMPFLVSIPSMIRCWYRELIIRSGKKKYSDLPDYDAIWFEGWATRLGEKHFK